MRTRPCPQCCLCGAAGEPLYRGSQDRLFGTPGSWDHSRCPNPGCGLVWLDPMPVEEEIGQAYQSYYTHEPGGDAVGSPVKAALRHVYHHWLRARRSRRYLSVAQPGRLLDVGCGDGSWLAGMREMGWQVEGQDVDAQAAARARSAYNVPVRLGQLQEVAFAENAFDAITMNHVIEHLHDPVGVLRECHRLLKPGGTLVAITPNVESYGHHRFGASWRDLDPPRHLHLFSTGALRACAEKAGFHSAEAWTTPVNAPSIYLGSRNPAGLRGSSAGRVLQAAGFTLTEFALAPLRPKIGEEAVLRVVK